MSSHSTSKNKRASDACIVIADSGMGTVLQSKVPNDGVDLGPWWSASVVASQPEAIKEVHRSNIEAGSDVILTATYQVYTSLPDAVVQQMNIFPPVAFQEDAVYDVCRAAVELANSAVAASSRIPSGVELPPIARSIGPIGSAIPGGHEFTGAYVVDKDIVRDFYTCKLSALLLPTDDDDEEPLVAFETFPRLDEAVLVLDLLESLLTADHLRQRSCRCWVSFVTHDGEHLACGTPIDEIVPTLERFLLNEAHGGLLVGIGFNCSYSASAERAAVSLLSRKTSNGAKPSCFFVWKPNVSPEAAPEAAGPHNSSISLLLHALRESTERVMKSVVKNRQFNRGLVEALEEGHVQSPSGENGFYLFDRMICGGCCGTTPDEILFMSRLRSALCDRSNNNEEH